MSRAQAKQANIDAAKKALAHGDLEAAEWHIEEANRIKRLGQAPVHRGEAVAPDPIATEIARRANVIADLEALR